MKTYCSVFAAVLAVSLCHATFAGAQTIPKSYGPPASPVGYMQGEAPAMPAQPMMDAYSSACGCGSGSCGDCADCGSCCDGWTQRFQVWGDYIYLRPRDVEVAYAVEINGPVGPGTTANDPVIQVSPLAMTDHEYQPGFRFGFGYTLDNCNQVAAQFTHFDATTTDAITAADPNNVIRSLVSPTALGVFNANGDGLDADAEDRIQFQLIDVDYKGLLAYCCDYKMGYVVGVRYARLEQDFAAQFQTNNVDTVLSNINFDGVGLRLGLEGERYGRNKQWFAYGKGVVSLVGGEFSSTYRYGTNADPVIVNTGWEAGRLVTIADLEVGAGWQNECGNLRLSVGYMYSSWFNTLKTNEWISAVRQNNFVDPADTTLDGMISFDGLTARVEVLW